MNVDRIILDTYETRLAKLQAIRGPVAHHDDVKAEIVRLKQRIAELKKANTNA